MSFADNINGFKRAYTNYNDTTTCPFDKTVGGEEASELLSFANPYVADSQYEFTSAQAAQAYDLKDEYDENDDETVDEYTAEEEEYEANQTQAEEDKFGYDA